MPQLVITDIESDGQESSTVYEVADFQAATDALLADLNRTASAEFTDVASHYWAAKGNVAGFAFTLSNTAESVGLADMGDRVRFAYLP